LPRFEEEQDDDEDDEEDKDDEEEGDEEEVEDELEAVAGVIGDGLEFGFTNNNLDGGSVLQVFSLLSMLPLPPPPPPPSPLAFDCSR